MDEIVKGPELVLLDIVVVVVEKGARPLGGGLYATS